MIITKGLSSGQHLYHIMINNTEITSSKSTIYRNFHNGYYSASILNLPRAVKFKRRSSHLSLYVSPAVKKAHTYQDFLFFTENNPEGQKDSQLLFYNYAVFSKTTHRKEPYSFS